MNHTQTVPTSPTLASASAGWHPSYTVQVRHALGGSPYCVPAALSAITGLTTAETTQLLKDQWVGDSAVRGIFYPAALKVLNSLGYSYQEWRFLEQGGLYLLVLPRHVGVWWENKFYDNSNPTGTNQGTPGKARIKKIFRIWKEEGKEN